MSLTLFIISLTLFVPLRRAWTGGLAYFSHNLSGGSSQILGSLQSLASIPLVDNCCFKSRIWFGVRDKEDV